MPKVDVRQQMACLYKRFDMDRAHARQVADLCDRIFTELPHLHGLPKSCRPMVEAAALLHDIGEAGGKKGHDLRSANQVKKLRLPWLPASWKPLIAQAIALHSTRSDVKGFLRRLQSNPSPELGIAGRVAAILRLGDGLDRCRGQNTDIASIYDDGRQVTLYVEPSPNSEENAAFALGKADLWNRLALRPIRAVEVAGKSLPNPAWVRPNQSIAEAVRRILQRQFEQWTSRQYGVGYRHDPEFVHEMRVATRRTHSAIGAPGTHIPGLTKLDRDLRKQVKPLGDVRDSDVLLAYLEGYARGAPKAHHKVLGGIISRRKWQRQKQYDGLLATMVSREYRDAMARLRRFVQPPPEEGASARSRPVKHRAWREARKALRAQLAEAWKHGRRLKQLSPLQQHAVRIECKKLRYLAEFFRDFFGRGINDMIEAASELQDLLGNVHDLYVYNDWLDEQTRNMAGRGRAAIGRLKRHIRRQQRECLDKAGKIWKTFRGRRSRKRLARLIDSPGKA